MKTLLRLALGAGILFVVAVGGHLGLQALAAGDGGGGLQARAAASCANCHGGGD